MGLQGRICRHCVVYQVFYEVDFAHSVSSGLHQSLPWLAVDCACHLCYENQLEVPSAQQLLHWPDAICTFPDTGISNVGMIVFDVVLEYPIQILLLQIKWNIRAHATVRITRTIPKHLVWKCFYGILCLLISLEVQQEQLPAR